MRSAIATLPLFLLPLTAEARPTDPVTSWNQTLIELFKVTSSIDPEVAAYSAARMNGSMFDAINAIEGGYEPYLFSLERAPDPGSISPEAAAAQAAHDALVVLPWFQDQIPVIESMLVYELSLVPDGPEKTAGIALGQQAAAAMNQDRENDGSTPIFPSDYTPGTAAGFWNPIPPDYLPADKPWWGSVRPFVLESVEGFGDPPGLPDMHSETYTALYDQVKSLGALDSTTRTDDQTYIALFWSEQIAGQRTPPGSWLVITADVAQRQRTDLIETSRLFALVSFALADAGIDAWDVKYTFNWWRPVTAIRNADEDGNPNTVADPDWNSLIPAPNFPAYFSGHSDFGWAAASALTGYFGTDEVAFVASSDTLPFLSLQYTSFSAAASDNGDARIYLGVHFNNDNCDAKAVGSEIGHYVVDHVLQPLSGTPPVVAKRPPRKFKPTLTLEPLCQ